MNIKRLSLLTILLGSLALPLVPDPGMAQGTSGPYLAAMQAESRGDVAAAARFYSRALARDGANLTLLERAMLNNIAAGNVAEGVALARRLDSEAPGHHLGVLALAADALVDGEMDEVRGLLSNGGPYVGQVIDAWAMFGDGDVDEALARLAELEETDANGRQGSVLASTHRAHMLAADDRDAEAVEVFAEVAAMTDGGTLAVVRAQAGSLARLGRTDEAVALIEARLAGTFGDPGMSRLAADIAANVVPQPAPRTAVQGAADVLFNVARLLVRGQSQDVSLAYTQLAAYLDPRRTDARLLIAQVFEAMEQYDLAITAYEAVPADAPEALSALLGRAEVLQMSGEEDSAIEAMRAAVDQFPESLEAQTSLGDMLRRASRFTEAWEAYDVAVALLPEADAEYWPLYYRRGIALERDGQWERAEADFRLALEMSPDQPDVLNYLGYSLVEMGEKLPEAEEMIRKAVEQRPDDGYIVDSLGWVLYRFGEFDAAVEQLERAVELRPVDPVINDHFGDALWMVGRRIEARFQWKRALSFDPDEKDAIRIRRKLETGLDTVLAEEAKEGLPGIIGRQTGNDTEPAKNDGG